MSVSMRTKLLLPIVAATVVGGTAVAVWRNGQTELRQQNLAEQMIEEELYRDALEVIALKELDGDNREWLSMRVQCLIALRQTQALKTLFFKFPDYFGIDETAALTVARSLNSQGDEASYSSIRKLWRGREAESAAWLSLDADRLVRSGKKSEAIELLDGLKLPVGENAGRLTRLAILSDDNAAVAWGHLEAAFRDNSRNPEVRLFRAQMLEASERIQEARVEYVAACLADVTNPNMHDQLARFYQRRGNLFQAITAWSQGVEHAATDFLEFDLLFWGKLAHPTMLDWNGRQLSAGRCRNSVQYLVELPIDQFWMQESFEQVLKESKNRTTRPELYWLQVLHFLKNGELEQARATLLQRRAEIEPSNSDLFRALSLSLNYKLTGELDPNRSWAANQDPSASRHRFLNQIDRLHAAEHSGASGTNDESMNQTRAFLSSSESEVALVMATGWIEAGIQLHNAFDSESSESLPNWYHYMLTQGLRMNRGPENAMRYLADCGPAPELQLIQAELLLAADQSEQSAEILDQLRKEPGGIGRRAAWLLCIMRLDEKKWEAARWIVEEQPTLRESVTGKELFAHIEYGQGNPEIATAIMKSIVNVSAQAKAFLARQAFSSNDFDTSERLIQEMQQELPDVITLRSNLQAINSARLGSSN